MKKTKNKGVGFPNYFKKIGGVLIVLVIIVILIIIGLHYNFNTTQKGHIKILALTLINLGLAFIALAKDKIEDEMFVHLKLKSIYGAFFSGIVFTIIYPLLDVVTNDDIQIISAQQLVTTMLFFHITMYYLLKRSEK